MCSQLGLCPGDLELRFGSSGFYSFPNSLPFHTWTLPNGATWVQFHRTTGGYVLRFPDLADFYLSEGMGPVVCVPSPTAAEPTVLHLYQTQVIPLVLGRLGRIVFHSSAVDLEGRCVAFAAESGRGKSTLAASFAINGFRFLTDDVLLLEPVDDLYIVRPSHPSIRLWKDSRDALVSPDAPQAPAICYTSKARFLADQTIAYCEQSRPLRSVYFLGDGSAKSIELEPVRPSEAMMEWVKHSFILDIEDKPRLTSHFQRVTDLADKPIHFRLDYPRRYDILPEVRRAVIDHVASMEGEVA